jgi:hypothetical protein
MSAIVSWFLCIFWKEDNLLTKVSTCGFSDCYISKSTKVREKWTIMLATYFPCFSPEIVGSKVDIHQQILSFYAIPRFSHINLFSSMVCTNVPREPFINTSFTTENIIKAGKSCHAWCNFFQGWTKDWCKTLRSLRTKTTKEGWVRGWISFLLPDFYLCFEFPGSFFHLLLITFKLENQNSGLGVVFVCT